MKRLFLVLMLLVFAGSVFAAELKVSGDAMVRGTYWNNKDLAEKEEATWSNFDYDFNINMAFVANEKATVFTKFTFDKNVNGDGKVADGDGTPYKFDDNGEIDTTYGVLNVERAYINYKFAPFLQLNTGLMAGGQWASAFNDTEINVMRVQFIGALSQDMVFIATYQKDEELGYNAKGGEGSTLKDYEKDDMNTYYLSSVMKFGPIKVLPLLTYVTKGINHDGGAMLEAGYAQALDKVIAGSSGAITTRDQAASFLAGAALTEDQFYAIQVAKGKYDANVMAFTLGLNGDFGMVGFESEFVVKKMDTDGFYDDHTALAQAAGYYDDKQYGAYVDLFVKIDPAKVGFVYAYGSGAQDAEEGSFNWGDDLDMFAVVDDWIVNDTDNSGLTGFSAYKIYADAAFGQFFAGVAVGMGESNIKDDKAAFTEYDAKVGYNFDENTTYTIGGGLAQLEKWKTDEATGKLYDCDVYRVYHKFAVKF